MRRAPWIVPSGLSILNSCGPRAWPWAGLGRTFGASEGFNAYRAFWFRTILTFGEPIGASRRSDLSGHFSAVRSAEGAASSQPRAPPWVKTNFISETCKGDPRCKETWVALRSSILNTCDPRAWPWLAWGAPSVLRRELHVSRILVSHDSNV